MELNILTTMVLPLLSLTLLICASMVLMVQSKVKTKQLSINALWALFSIIIFYINYQEYKTGPKFFKEAIQYFRKGISGYDNSGVLLSLQWFSIVVMLILTILTSIEIYKVKKIDFSTPPSVKFVEVNKQTKSELQEAREEAVKYFQR